MTSGEEKFPHLLLDKGHTRETHFDSNGFGATIRTAFYCQ